MSVEGSGLDGGLRCHPDRSNTSPILISKDISLKIGAVSVKHLGVFQHPASHSMVYGNVILRQESIFRDQAATRSYRSCNPPTAEM